MTPSLFGFTFLNLWWISLLIVLPLGSRKPDIIGHGHSPGTPENPHLRRKCLLATALSLTLTCLLALAIHFRLISLKNW